MEETNSEINENKININSDSEMLTCLDCPYIPSIKINTNQHAINVECQNNIKISTNNDISGHFHHKILLNDYLTNIKNNFENNKKKCSFCNHLIKIDNIYYCSFCKAFICSECINNMHLEQKRDHPALKLELINTCCCIHNKINKFYCKNCFKNICDFCLKYNKFHNNHEIINLDDILVDEKYLKEIDKEINNEEKEVNIITKKFDHYINFLQKKFDEYIQLRNDEIDLKRNILYNYDKYKNNYNSIMNAKKLKFDYFKFNLDNEKGEEKNLNQLKNFKKLLNELIIYEETRFEQEKKKQDIKTGNNNQNDNNDIKNLKENSRHFKENYLLKSSKYEVVNRINTKHADAEIIVTLKNNKLLIGYTNRDLVIYGKNDLKNILEELCKVNLSSTKFNSIRSNIINFKGIYQLKNENILISMSGLSNFILNVNYDTKTFTVVQEFMISRGLRLNNPLFLNLPIDPNNYDDVIPVIPKKGAVINNNVQMNNNSDNINNNLNINNIINNTTNDGNIKSNEGQNTIKNFFINHNNLNNNNPNINNNANPTAHQIRFFPFPHGIFQRITNRIGVPIGHPLPHNIVQRVNNPHQRKRTLINLVALQNDDLLAISHKDCWILRNSGLKYLAYKDEIIKCDKLIMIKKALPISDNEFVIEILLPNTNKTLPNHIIKPGIKKNNLAYIFFNLNYEETYRRNLMLFETVIRSDNNYIYIKDLHSLLLMSNKNKEVIHIIEVDSLGPIVPIKLNKSFIIQEKENNAIVEYRIIDNEVVKSEKLMENQRIKLLTELDDDFNTLIIQHKNESLLFLQ